MVPARDGIKLGTNVFLPARGGSVASDHFSGNRRADSSQHTQSCGLACRNTLSAMAKRSYYKMSVAATDQEGRCGATQHALAIANALNLAARVPVDAMSNVGRYGVRHNGASLPDALYASEN